LGYLKVQRMTSIRQPKCITIRGNDQKEHRFLVKCGEDQRQDERIETLFDLINDLLKLDSKCYQRNLSLRTYQVIPMTSKLALIEWMPETNVLKTMLDDPQLVEKHVIDEVTRRHIEFIESVTDKEMPLYDKFLVTFEHYSREMMVKEFDRIQSRVPWDLMRRYIRSLSASTEAYFVLRNQFITSYAVASACQYILGIGDRHLSNWLIDLRTGRAIGIDFGMAFGHGTLNIHIPELMPIRLTRQILKLMAPLEQSGLFQATMVHILQALRENNDLLMCVLDVFVKEPSIDWIVNYKIILIFLNNGRYRAANVIIFGPI
jgi:DNA-dependent protein kinase catalytic subunit